MNRTRSFPCSPLLSQVLSCPATYANGFFSKWPTLHRLRVRTVGTDKRDFTKPFLTAFFRQRIRLAITAKTTGREPVHQWVRWLGRDGGLAALAMASKKIEKLWRGAKCWHGFRRFPRRGLLQVRVEAYWDGLDAEFQSAGAPAATTSPLWPSPQPPRQSLHCSGLRGTTGCFVHESSGNGESSGVSSGAVLRHVIGGLAAMWVSVG